MTESNLVGTKIGKSAEEPLTAAGAGKQDLAEELDAARETLCVLEEDLAEKAEEVMRLRLELEAKQRRYEALFRLAPDAYLVTDMHGTIRDANEAAADLLNLASELVRGKPLAVFVVMGDRDKYRSTLNGLKNGISRRDWDLRLQPRKSEERCASIAAAVMPDGSGRSEAILWQIRDVTDQRRLERKLAVRALEIAVLMERSRMARELHDTLAQGFTGIFLLLEAAEDALPSDHKEAARHLFRARELARSSLNEARRAVHALRPAALEAGDLHASLRSMIHQMEGTGTEVVLKLEGEAHLLRMPVEDNLLRICQEALTNSIRHGNASRVEVGLAFEDRRLQLSVEDNGTGFDHTLTTGAGMGLMGMEERAEALGGDLKLASRPGQGTRITVTVPLDDRHRGVASSAANG